MGVDKEVAAEHPLVCPVEHPDCQWLQELAHLRAEIDELRRLVSHDPLTALYNFRFFQQAAKREMEATRRSGLPTCLILVDLDHFKQVNDQYGHEAGNEVLKQTAQVLTHTVRVSDIVCRYGGEEFVIILPQSRLPMSVQIAERLRAAIEAEPVNYEQTEIRLTASLGVAKFDRVVGEVSVEDLVKQADEYMYQAKQSGRNRVCHPEIVFTEPAAAVSSDEKSALFAAINEPSQETGEADPDDFDDMKP